MATQRTAFTAPFPTLHTTEATQNPTKKLTLQLKDKVLDAMQSRCRSLGIRNLTRTPSMVLQATVQRYMTYCQGRWLGVCLL